MMLSQSRILDYLFMDTNLGPPKYYSGALASLSFHQPRFNAHTHRETEGAIHLTKISGNSGTKSNGTKRFWKFVSKIVDNLRRLSFFLEIWKFRKFPVPFGISTRFESTPVPLVVKSYKMAASKSIESTLHWKQNDLPRLEPVPDRKRKR